MAETYKIWLEILDEEQDRIACAESLEMEFTTLEAAEAIRTMMLGMMDGMSTYIVQTYAPVYARVEELEDRLGKAKDPEPFYYEGRYDERETPTGEGGPEGTGNPVGNRCSGPGCWCHHYPTAEEETRRKRLSSSASGDPETELTRQELDFLDAQAEDSPGAQEDTHSAGVEHFRAGRLTQGSTGTHRRES